MARKELYALVRTFGLLHSATLVANALEHLWGLGSGRVGIRRPRVPGFRILRCAIGLYWCNLKLNMLNCGCVQIGVESEKKKLETEMELGYEGIDTLQ